MTFLALTYRGKLKQSPTLEELMRYLIMFLHIARGTSQYNKVDIVPRTSLSTAYRDCVFNVVDILPFNFLKLCKATCCIVATILLSFQFLLNLGRNQSTFYGFLLCFALLVIYLPDHPSTFCLKILSVSCIVLFSMSIIIDFVSCINLFSIQLTRLFSLLSYLFLMDNLIVMVLLFPPLPVLLVILFKVVRMGISPDFALRFFTYLTRWIKAILLGCVSSKKLSGSRVEVQTLGASLAGQAFLGYSIHTVSLLKMYLSSCLGMLTHRSGTTLLPLNYTTNPLYKEPQEVYYHVH